MTPPTTGRVAVDDIDIYGLGAERLADFRREYLGFVFQHRVTHDPVIAARADRVVRLCDGRIVSG